MTLTKLPAYKDSNFFNKLIHHNSSNRVEIFELLKEDGHGKIDIMNLYNEQSTGAFALYGIYQDKVPSVYAKSKCCIGYRYGRNYNNSGEKWSYLPKVLFLNTERVIWECVFMNDNVFVHPVESKDLGRDSYYPNQYQYVTEKTWAEIVQALIERSQLKVYLSAKARLHPNDFDARSAFREMNEFESQTWYSNSYLFAPLREIAYNEPLTASKKLSIEHTKATSYGIRTLSKSQWEAAKKVLYTR